MELLQLKYFCDAAETENFSKTAEKFLVPVSNISQTIKRLEKELNTPLFERYANRVKINESGLLFYKKVHSALNLLQDAEDSLRNEPTSQTIRINIHINRRIVMEVIEKFRKHHPEIYFIATHITDEASDEYDIIITDRQLTSSYLKTEVTDEALLLAYNKKIFAFETKPTAASLKSLPFITMSSGNSTYENTKRICGELGFSPRIVLQSEDPFYIRKCIELGLGISIVPEISWQGQFSKDVALLKIGDYKRNVFLYRKHNLSSAANEFHQMLIDEFCSLRQNKDYIHSKDENL